MEGLKPNKVGFKSVPTSCPQHGVVDTCCLCPGGYGCETHTEIGGYGYCTNEKYIKLNLEATSGTMIKTNARDVCNHCMNKRRKKEARDNCASTLELNKDKDKEKEEESIKNCASALLELKKEKEAIDFESIKKCASALLELNKEDEDESIKKCASALLSLEDEKKEEPKKDGKRKVKSRRKSKSRRRRKSKK